MKAIIIAILLFATTAAAEDWCGYVLRRDYCGRDYYWVHDSAWDAKSEAK